MGRGWGFKGPMGYRGYRSGPWRGKIFPSGNLRRTSAQIRSGVTLGNEAGESGDSLTCCWSEKFVALKLRRAQTGGD